MSNPSGLMGSGKGGDARSPVKKPVVKAPDSAKGKGGVRKPSLIKKEKQGEAPTKVKMLPDGRGPSTTTQIALLKTPVSSGGQISQPQVMVQTQQVARAQAELPRPLIPVKLVEKEAPAAPPQKAPGGQEQAAAVRTRVFFPCCEE